ncbi:hypothetical protein D3C78_1764500 [compost metagenome]
MLENQPLGTAPRIDRARGRCVCDAQRRCARAGQSRGVSGVDGGRGGDFLLVVPDYLHLVDLVCEDR